MSFLFSCERNQKAPLADQSMIANRKSPGLQRISAPSRAARRFLFVLLTMAAAWVFVPGALANNTFPGTTISGSSGSFTGTTVGSNGEAGEPAPPAGGAINSMWYSWTAPASGVFTFGTCNTTAASTTNYDSAIAAYTGAAVNALTTLGGVDDVTGCASTAGADLGSVVAFTATSGTTYRLQIDGYQANTGAFQLNYGLVGFVFATTDGSATEGGDTGAFTVRLTSVPTANVTVTIGASTQCTFAATTLTFTLANWNVPQTVTATATNDAVVEGVHSCTPASITAAGGNFNTATGTPPVITVNDNDSATVTIANTTNGAEPATNGLMTVTQTAVSATNTVIAYSIGGTATSGSDYTALSGTVTILAGATTATIPIPVLDDATVELNETVIVTLTSITSGLPTLGATLVATNTITSNDAATVSLANTTNGAEPATNGLMTVTQTLASATNTVIAYSIGGTATAGADYTALSGTVTVLAGATTATIPIPILDDAVVEGPETVIVTLTSITSGLATLGAPLAATNTIADNDAATVSIANTTNGAEPATNGLMTVTQTAVSATNTVISYSVSGTASSGLDFTALSGSVTVIAGATTATITIPVLNDAIVEGNETVIVTLTTVSSGLATLGAPLAATNTIADNDVGTIVVVNTDNAATETAGNTGAFTVALGLQPSVNVTVTIGASAQCNYAPTTLTFTTANWNVAQTVTVTPVDDAVVEGPHTCSPASISAAGGAYAGVTGTPPVTNITDNDSATVSIANTTNGAEPATNGVMTVTQTAVSATNTVIAYTVTGTATSGTDYTALSGTVTVIVGATTATISIPVLDDAIVEGGETVIVTLTSVTSGLATLGAPLIATNTIGDNDSATVSIANAINGAEPASNGTMTVTQTAVSSQNTVIAYTVTGTATSGADYTALSGTVTVLAGATTATISIPVLDDSIVEAGETVIVTLTSVSSGLATLGAPLAATNTIGDNDSATVSIANTTNASEPATNGTLTVTQTAVASQNTVISYTVTGTATSGTDYAALSGTVTVLAGATTATINVSIIDDLILDPSETVIITLSGISSGLATLGAPLAATNTIADNDVASFSIAKTVNTPTISAPVTLTYTITVANTGNVPLTGLSITDALLQGGSPRTLTSGPSYASGDTDLDGQIDATETWIYAATYAVTQPDIDNSTAFANTATFDTAETPGQTSNAAATTITVNPQLVIDKTANTLGPLSAGQVINYSYLVTNTGNVTISGVNVNETAFNGNGTPVPAPIPTGPTTLSPGQTVTFVASYTVTQDDIDLLQ